MSGDSLATPCGLYCGFCRFYMNQECRGCGSPDRLDCNILKCCRGDKNLQFCTECEDFLCKELRNSIGLDPRWLEELAKLPLKRKEP
ncbi:MAG: DUF3795 domain-containing protein [Candidatus Hodarchaeota archaeon]